MARHWASEPRLSLDSSTVCNGLGGNAGTRHVRSTESFSFLTVKVGFAQKTISVGRPMVSTIPVVAFTSADQTRETESLVTLTASKTIGIMPRVFVFPWNTRTSNNRLPAAGL